MADNPLAPINESLASNATAYNALQDVSALNAALGQSTAPIGDIEQSKAQTAQIAKTIQAQNSGTPDYLQSLNSLMGKYSGLSKAGGDNSLQDITYDVPKTAVYDRLNDGSYVAKYENYQGAIGNEDRLANQQSAIEQIGNGLGKNLTKIFTYAADGVNMATYGLYSAITKGSVDALWNNDVSQWLDDQNKKLDYALPNYYSDEEKSKGFFGRAFTNPANFLANDVAGGLAFVGGAILPEIAIGLISGGASVPGSLAKLGARVGIKSLDNVASAALKSTDEILEGATKVANQATRTEAKNSIRGLLRANFGNTAGDILNTGRFIAQSTFFEAGMEARGSFNDAVDTYIANYKAENGSVPSIEELSTFTDEARRSSNMLFGANVALLALTNAAMFGKTFGLKNPISFPGLTRRANNVIGLGVAGELGQQSLKVATRGQKLLGKSYMLARNPISEGIVEEGLQGVFSKTMNNYLESKYKEGGSYSLLSSVTDAFAEQYGSKEGWFEMGIGGIIGLIGGKLGGNSTSYNQTRVGIEAQLNQANKGVETLRSMNRASSFMNFKNAQKDNADQTVSTAEDTMGSYNYLKSQEGFKSTSEIKSDYETIINNFQFDDATKARLDLSDESSISDYKANLISEFEQDIQFYNKAKKTVNSLGLNRANVETGDQSELSDALTYNLMLGMKAGESSRKVAEQISSMIGSGGVFDALNFYSQLDTNQRNAVAELQEKRAELEQAREEAIRLGSEVGLAQGNDQQFKEASRKVVVANSNAVKLQQTVDELTSALENDFQVSNFNLDTNNPSFNNVVSSIDEVNKIDNYITSLRKAGKTYEAQSLEYAVEQFKSFSDAEAEITGVARRMLATNFFSTNEGKSLLSKVKGKEYKMSQEFLNLINENDEYIDQSLNLYGIRGYETVEQELRSTIENNPNLSQREKFQAESVMRLILSMRNIQAQVNSMADTIEIISEVENLTTEVNSDTLEGDTVVLAQKLNLENLDLSNPEILKKLISQITTQLDFIINKTSSATSEEITEKQQQLDNLRAQLENVQEEEMIPVEDAEFQEFVNTGFVMPSRLENIANKVAQNINLDVREQAIFTDNTSEINEIIQEEDFEITPVRSEIERQISAAENELSDLQSPYKIVDSPTFQRYYELTRKAETEGLTPEETIEQDNLKSDVDQWIFISGTTTEGLDLSDLIRQQIVLENTPILPLQNINLPTTEDVEASVKIADASGNNYQNGLVFDAVTFNAINGGDEILYEISGITPDALQEELGFPFEYTQTTSTKNILISEKEAERIQQNSGIIINPTNQNMRSNYSIVLKSAVNMAGREVLQPLKSNFGESFHGGGQDIQAVYNTQVGDNMYFQIDPLDEFNKPLMSQLVEVAKSSSPLTAEERIEKEGEEFNRLKEKDVPFQVAAERLGEISQQLKSKKIEKEVREKLTRELKTVTDRINKRVKTLKVTARVNVEKRPLKQAKPSVELLEDIKNNLVIRVVDKEGNFVSVLKGIRGGSVSSETAMKFDALRSEILADTEMLTSLAQTSSSTILTIPGFKVKRVLPGHPNYNFVQSEAGLAVEFTSITRTTNIEDIGYISDGKLMTRKSSEAVDTTFVNKLLKSPNALKTPIVVIRTGNKKLAYPVRMNTQDPGNLQQFQDLYNSDMDSNDKVIALNRFLAARGVDIKQTGNAFMVVVKSNLTDEFFQNKLAQLQEINYFSDIESWIDPSSDMQTILVNNTSIDLNLADPFHSPKLQFDLSGIEVKQEFTEETRSKKKSESKKTFDKKISNLTTLIKQNC